MRLERIRQIDSANVEAALTLEPIYEAHGDYRKLAMILEVLAESVDDQDQRLSYLGRLAKIYEEHLRNPMAAFDWLRQALELGGIDSNTRSELRRLGALTNQWGTVHDSLADIVDQVDDVGERTEILLALGSILDEHLNSVTNPWRGTTKPSALTKRTRLPWTPLNSSTRGARNGMNSLAFYSKKLILQRMMRHRPVSW